MSVLLVCDSAMLARCHELSLNRTLSLIRTFDTFHGAGMGLGWATNGGGAGRRCLFLEGADHVEANADGVGRF
ncbi:MAG: hypothetical protein ACREP1_06640, partial [Rhodanobacteraceae bacterium]